MAIKLINNKINVSAVACLIDNAKNVFILWSSCNKKSIKNAYIMILL